MSYVPSMEFIKNARTYVESRVDETVVWFEQSTETSLDAWGVPFETVHPSVVEWVGLNADIPVIECSGARCAALDDFEEHWDMAWYSGTRVA